MSRKSEISLVGFAVRHASSLVGEFRILYRMDNCKMFTHWAVLKACRRPESHRLERSTLYPHRNKDMSLAASNDSFAGYRVSLPLHHKIEANNQNEDHNHCNKDDRCGPHRHSPYSTLENKVLVIIFFLSLVTLLVIISLLIIICYNVGMPSTGLLLHPVRLRIVQRFLGGRTLTTKELAAEISDVPPASLYRHVARLEEGGALVVVRERKVRGTLERTYALKSRALDISLDELKNMTADDHRHIFISFAARLISDFEQFIDQDELDPEHDSISYQVQTLWLDKDEANSLARDIAALLDPYLANVAQGGRKRQTFFTAIIPATRSNNTSH